MPGNQYACISSAMDKKAVMYAVVALVIILVAALVVKPVLTGQPLIQVYQ